MVNDFLDLAVFEIAEQDAEGGEEYEGGQKGGDGTAEHPENQATTNPETSEQLNGTMSALTAGQATLVAAGTDWVE